MTGNTMQLEISIEERLQGTHLGTDFYAQVYGEGGLEARG